MENDLRLIGESFALRGDKRLEYRRQKPQAPTVSSSDGRNMYNDEEDGENNAYHPMTDSVLHMTHS